MGHNGAFIRHSAFSKVQGGTGRDTRLRSDCGQNGSSTCGPASALILTSVLIAIAASGSPTVGVLAMLALELGQGRVLVAAGDFGGVLVRLIVL